MACRSAAGSYRSVMHVSRGAISWIFIGSVVTVCGPDCNGHITPVRWSVYGACRGPSLWSRLALTCDLLISERELEVLWKKLDSRLNLSVTYFSWSYKAKPHKSDDFVVRQKSHDKIDQPSAILKWISQFICHNQTSRWSTQAQIMTTYEKHLYGVTGMCYPRSWCSAYTGYPCIENVICHMCSKTHKRTNPQKTRKERT